MKYDFTSIMDRMGKDAIAVEALGQNPMAPKPPKEGLLQLKKVFLRFRCGLQI